MHATDGLRSLADALVRQGAIDGDEPDRLTTAGWVATALALGPRDWRDATHRDIDAWACAAATRLGEGYGGRAAQFRGR